MPGEGTMPEQPGETKNILSQGTRTAEGRPGIGMTLQKPQGHPIYKEWKASTGRDSCAGATGASPENIAGSELLQ
jgi:hypothetical protein